VVHPFSILKGLSDGNAKCGILVDPLHFDFGLSSFFLIVDSTRVRLVATRDRPGFRGMTPMQVSTVTVRRRFLGLLISGGGFLAWSIAGCGPSENKVEMDPDAKKSVLQSKVGDPSKFVKPGKGPVGRR
jgi:hypothetical protein